MCGITGFNKKDEPLLIKATTLLAHRGPDQFGYFTDSNVSLGHRRLSVIDLSEKGRQPMQSKDGSLVIVFNGEIYNYQELREKLERNYHCSFQSNSDTEVILKSYEKMGAACFNSFNGMWALCIYDKKKKQLILSRDRLGKKPLYYYWDKQHFIFGSELKSILVHDVPKKINQEALDFYFTLGYIPSPLSIYQNIHKLGPRQYLILDLKKKTLKIKTYFEIPNYNPVHDRDALIEEGKALLSDATRLRLISDVPVGAFLSGGLDSSSVVAAMAQYTDLKKLHTFSMGFVGAYDETNYMLTVKDFLKTKHHHSYYAEKDFEHDLNIISFYFDEPFADYSNFPTYSISGKAKQFVTVCLSGDGGDEIFGGYTLHQAAAQLTAIKKIPVWMRKILKSILPQSDPLTFFGKAREALRLSLLPSESFLAELGDGFLYKPKAYKTWSIQHLKAMLQTSQQNLAEAVIRYDLYYNTLSDNFLAKVDRASMAHALEIRSPFLDYRFLELEAKIPIEWKVSRAKTKILMREIIKGMLPKSIVNRGKQGFTPPLDQWIRKEKYVQICSAGLEQLHSQNCIDSNWYQFYKEKVLPKNHFLYNIYLIRLLLLIKWNERWNKQP